MAQAIGALLDRRAILLRRISVSVEGQARHLVLDKVSTAELGLEVKGYSKDQRDLEAALASQVRENLGQSVVEHPLVVQEDPELDSNHQALEVLLEGNCQAEGQVAMYSKVLAVLGLIKASKDLVWIPAFKVRVDQRSDLSHLPASVEMVAPAAEGFKSVKVDLLKVSTKDQKDLEGPLGPKINKDLLVPDHNQAREDLAAFPAIKPAVDLIPLQVLVDKVSLALGLSKVKRDKAVAEEQEVTKDMQQVVQVPVDLANKEEVNEVEDLQVVQALKVPTFKDKEAQEHSQVAVGKISLVLQDHLQAQIDPLVDKESSSN